jgi:DNA-binding MarR family transcriptional regulator/GNAT superfamily N-acetyltransferase
MSSSVDVLSPPLDAEQIAAVRAFNRAWTEASALLDDDYLASGLSLPAARLIYELAQRSPQPVVDLRGRLRLDPGYTTRLLDRLADRSLITRAADPADRRRQLITLTDAGREASEQLNVRSDELVGALLDPLRTEDRVRLVAALDTIGELLGVPSAAPIRIRPIRVGEFGWILSRHAQLYQEEYGWPGFEAEVAKLIADYLANEGRPRQRFWVAERNGRLLGSVGCAQDDEVTARLRLLLVEPAARGHRLGTRLVDECVAFARSAGYQRIVLHTQDALTAARKIYRSAGFVIERTSTDDSLDPHGTAEHWTLTLS